MHVASSFVRPRRWLLAISAIGCLHAAPFEWQTATPESHGLSEQKIEALRERLAAHASKAFLLVHDDRIVCQWYSADHGPTNPHFSASMAKALVGGISV